MQFRNFVVIAAIGLLVPRGAALAQQSQQQTQNQSTSAVETRPATTTFFGDTGLWFVPTGEVLPHKKVSVSGYRANYDREQGFTDISHFAVTVGVGL
ncbi:MAG: hypothetical protein HY654_13695, partial [Acidobacteria bacterium]|nr:hypothetical protein [Acidobacteriota bacterium]